MHDPDSDAPDLDVADLDVAAPDADETVLDELEAVLDTVENALDALDVGDLDEVEKLASTLAAGSESQPSESDDGDD